jgi:sugar phosphate isomerase/epimerase
MRLGIGSYAYAWSVGVPGLVPPIPMTAFDLLKKANQSNVRVVQVCDNLPLHALTDSEARDLLFRAGQLGIQLEVGTRGIDPIHLRTYLGLAQQFGSPLLRTVIDTADYQPSVDEAVSMLGTALPDFERTNVRLAIENHDRFTIREFLDILQRLDSPHIGICLDTVNSFGALEGPEVVVDSLAPWTVSLHVKEFSIRRVDHQMGFVIEGCPAGQGRLDIPWLLSRLKEAGRDPNAILEQWPPPEGTVEETIAKEQRWAEKSIAYLRTLIAD